MRAIVLTWFLTQLVILVGDLDLLLPIVSGCFLICFCAVNLTCFVLELWREGGGGSGGGNGGRRRRRHVHFNWYSKWSALLGFVLSLAATFLNAISGECGCVVVWLCGWCTVVWYCWCTSLCNELLEYCLGHSMWCAEATFEATLPLPTFINL